MKVTVCIFITAVSFSLTSCSAEQEVVAAYQNLKTYKQMDFSKAWGGLKYRESIRQEVEEQK